MWCENVERTRVNRKNKFAKFFLQILFCAEINQLVNHWHESYASPIRLKMFSICNVHIYKADQVELLLKSRTNITKGEQYYFLHSWLGVGLLTRWILEYILNPRSNFVCLQHLAAPANNGFINAKCWRPVSISTFSASSCQSLSTIHDASSNICIRKQPNRRVVRLIFVCRWHYPHWTWFVVGFIKLKSK